MPNSPWRVTRKCIPHSVPRVKAFHWEDEPRGPLWPRHGGWHPLGSAPERCCCFCCSFTPCQHLKLPLGGSLARMEACVQKKGRMLLSLGSPCRCLQCTSWCHQEFCCSEGFRAADLDTEVTEQSLAGGVSLGRSAAGNVPGKVTLLARGDQTAR